MRNIHTFYLYSKANNKMIYEGQTQLLYCNAILSCSTQRRMTNPETYLLINEPVVCMQFNPKHLTPLYIHTRIVIYHDQTILFMIITTCLTMCGSSSSTSIMFSISSYKTIKPIFSAVSSRQLFLRQKG